MALTGMTPVVSGSGGGGSAVAVKEGGVTKIAATDGLDFDDSDFNTNPSGSTALVALNYGAGSDQPAVGNHAHDTRYPTIATVTESLSGKSNTGHTHPTTDIASGTFTPARLGAGTASSANFLRGDSTWSSVPSGGGGSETFAGLTDTSFTSLATGQIPKWNGTAWTNQADATGGATDGQLIEYTVSDVATLRTRLTSAVAGDTINITTGTYALGSTPIIMTAVGTKANPIRVRARGPVVITGSGVDGPMGDGILRPNGAAWWIIDGLEIHTGQKIVMCYGMTDSIWRRCSFHNAGDEIFKFRNSSQRNLIEDCDFFDAHNRPGSSNGEGIYIGQDGGFNAAAGDASTDPSDYNIIRNCRFWDCYDESIEIKEGCSYNTIENCTFDAIGQRTDSTFIAAPVVVKGRRNVIRNNTFLRCNLNGAKMLNPGDTTATWARDNLFDGNLFYMSSPVLLPASGTTQTAIGGSDSSNRPNRVLDTNKIVTVHPGYTGSLTNIAQGVEGTAARSVRVAASKATVASGSTSVTVSHGLSATPQAVFVTPQGSLGSASSFWVATIGTTTFTINVNAAPGGSGVAFAWEARI